MSFSPILPAGGLLGWSFLSRTLETQQQTHAQSPQPARETEAFMERIGQITSAEALVQDRAVLKVALGAFGLEADLENRAFIQKVLQEGTDADDSFANRLADKRYAALADAFGFGNATGPRTQDPSFAATIAQRFLERDFEVAVGQADETMRLALTLQRELPEIVARGGSETTQWLRVLGNPPLRQTIETAFGLPSGFSGLDLDRQISDLQSLVRRRTGAESLAELAEPNALDTLTQLFVARAAPVATTTSSNPVLSLFSTPASAASILQILAQSR